MGVMVYRSNMELPQSLVDMLNGKQGDSRQKAARLVVDLARTASAEGFVEVNHSHVSGVSVITGGLDKWFQDEHGHDYGVEKLIKRNTFLNF